MHKEVVLIGYSGHSFVAIDILLSMNRKPTAYIDLEEKKYNPYQLSYWGNEENIESIQDRFAKHDYFISIGNNQHRQRMYNFFKKVGDPINGIHTNAFVSEKAKLEKGIMISSHVSVNAFAKIGTGVILNTGCIVEHECEIGIFSHIAPGAVLCGNVKVGEGTLIGANAVVKPGIKIGSNVIVGAGAVIVKDIPDGSKVIGNPQQVCK